MSDSWVTLIPKDPLFRPKENAFAEALVAFKKLAPNADEIKLIVSDVVRFYDCGTNFEAVYCPSCNTQIQIEQWQDLMSIDSNKKGFNLNFYELSCCRSSHNLNELNYSWHQGFSVFALEAMNPNVGELSEEAIKTFENILGTRLSAIYQHI